MGSIKTIFAKILYAALFVVLLPCFLVLFAANVEIPLTIERFPWIGAVFAGLGTVIMLWGMLDIRFRGNGLPMNAFPPEKLVVDGIYRWIPHPIYTGFVLICFGASLFQGSATGALLVTPIIALSATALVLGYERPYLLDTFGKLPRPVLGITNMLGPIGRALRLNDVWPSLLRLNERLANAWDAKRIGSARVINHAVFAGVAGGAGCFITVLAAGNEHVATVSLTMSASILGAAVVGQLMEGSSEGLSRPLGYFGGLLGIAAGGLVLSIFSFSMLPVLAAFALAGSWTQAIGRLRCIIQGCCHGAPTRTGDSGIVVVNPHSRVTLAGLNGTRIYPTQLYSILGNVVIGTVLASLWTAGVALTLVIGLYLVLAGLVRFVEERYRGEPRTSITGGLRIYQWFTIGMVIAGALAMMVDSENARPVTASAILPAVATGIVFFFVCGFAAGVDFPESTRKFSRLSG